MRRRRLTFAAPFVITAACSSSSKETPKPEIRMLAVTYEGEACVVQESCPKGVTCEVAQPYAYDCGPARYHAPGPNRHPMIAETDLFGMTPEGKCFERKYGCSTRDCLGAEAPCPSPAATPVRTTEWKVKRTGDRCRITPQAPSSITPAAAATEIVCPENYHEPIIAIVRKRDECIVVHYKERELDADDPCRNVNANCNPPQPRVVRCPEK